ncbi:hypothetical protein [Streptomyces violascens]|uniref:hypothetical protein n=1 Tax=Streptomyces violascens TaxID=67381 RepID=UPI003679ED54
MPQPSIRPDVVVLLTDVDTSRRTPDHLYRHDGSPFTAAELDLLHTCTPAEIDAANAQRQLQDDWKSEDHEIHKALVDLFTKYVDQLPDGTLCRSSDIYDLMTDQDYAECERLAEAIKARDPFGYSTEHGQG